MDSISSATPECLESSEQAKYQSRSNFGRCLVHSGPFQAVFFYFPELSHESPTKPWPEPQTLSPSKGTVRMAVAGRQKSTEGTSRLGSHDVAFPGTWPVHLGLAPPAPDGSQVPRAQQVPAALPSPRGSKRRVT